MDYELIISERADELTERLTSYLLNNLKNPGAAAHFLNELDSVYFLTVRMNTCSCGGTGRHCWKRCSTRLFTALTTSKS